MNNNLVKIAVFSGMAVATMLLLPSIVQAEPLSVPKLNFSLDGVQKPKEVVGAIKIMILLTVLTLAPAIMISMTSFTRIIIVFSFLRQAMGTQQVPPNQIMVGLALFLTFYIMAPAWEQINQNALKPYLAEEISQDTAITEALKPIRRFMLKQTKEKDLALFFKMSKHKKPQSIDEVPTYVVIPAFVLSELRTAFQMGFMLYVPFLIMDMVISSVLMGMGMMMLPPPLISLPLKVILFVLVDGWNLIINSLLKSFS